MSFSKIFLAWLLTIVCAACGCGQAPTPAKKISQRLEPVTLGLNWYPEVEHGGYYAALAHGYYEAEGLDVKIIPGGPDSPIMQQVATGARTFGVTNADNILLGRAHEAPVVGLMAPLQTSPRCIMVHADSGVKTFNELRDMTIALSNTQSFFFFLKLHAPLTNVKIVPYLGSVAAFLEDPRLAQQAYVFSEPYLAEQKGVAVRTLPLAELGFNPYTSLLFTNEQTLVENSYLARKMVAATRRGWKKYLESPEETNALIRRLNPVLDAGSLKFGAEAIRPLVLDEVAQKDGIGCMALERWRTLTEQMVECKLIKAGAVDPAKAFSTEFLEATCETASEKSP